VRHEKFHNNILIKHSLIRRSKIPCNLLTASTFCDVFPVVRHKTKPSWFYEP